VRRRRRDGRGQSAELIRALGERVPWRVIVAGGAARCWRCSAAQWRGGELGRLPQGSLRRCRSESPSRRSQRHRLLRLHRAAARGNPRPVPDADRARGRNGDRSLLGARRARLQGIAARVSPGAAAHLSVLLGLFFIQRAMSYWLGRFDLLLHTDASYLGLRYVDSNPVAAGPVAAGVALDRRGR